MAHEGRVRPVVKDVLLHPLASCDRQMSKFETQVDIHVCFRLHLTGGHDPGR
jgi:hypothetical protein